MIGGRCGFAHGVHGPNARSHVDSTQIKLRGQYVAERGSSGYVAVVDEILAWYAGYVADVLNTAALSASVMYLQLAFILMTGPPPSVG